MKLSKKKLTSLRRKRSRCVARLPDMECLLRGTLVERYKKCGKPGCHCIEGLGHGPATYLSVTLGPGKTRSFYIPAGMKEQIGQYLENHRRMRELVEEITRINWELLAARALDDEI